MTNMSDKIPTEFTEEQKKLLEKWSGVFDFTDDGKIKPKESNLNLNTAILIESQESWPPKDKYPKDDK